MPATPIIIDCDPGVDDAIALLLAFASPELHVLGVTTVAGNVPMQRVVRNAQQVCELAGRSDIGIYEGCRRPMLRQLATAEEVHGESGLGGVTLPEPTMPVQKQHGVDFLIDTLMASEGDISLATLGPLTNLAIALIKEPRIALKIKKVVMMGGSISHGNITPSAEFNIYVDPHAAQVVFNSGLDLTMIGLHVTHTILSTPARLDKIRAVGNSVGQIAADMLDFYGKHERDLGMEGGPLHDPCVIAYLLKPELFAGRDFYVQVETCSSLTVGQTVVDVKQTGDRPFPAPKPNANVLLMGDAEGFYQLLVERLATLE